MSDEMPPQPKTAELPAADPVQVLLLQMQRSMEAGFVNVGDRLDRQDKVLERVSSEGIEVNTRLARVEVRMEHVETGVEDLETRIGRASHRVQQASESDLAHESRLAAEIVARQALDAKVDDLAKGHAAIIEKTDAQTQILVNTATAVSKFVATPTVKIAGGILFGIVSTWLANHYGVALPK